MNNQYDVYLCRERTAELTEIDKNLLDNFLEEKPVKFSSKNRYAKMNGSTVVNSWLSYTIVGVK